MSDSFVTPMDCSLLGSSVCGIPQTRILEWVAICSSRGSFQPRDWTRVPCMERRIIYHWSTSCCCSVAKSCPTLCNPMDCSTPGFPVLHFWVSLNSCPLSQGCISSSVPPSPLAFSLSQHQGLFQWVYCSHQVIKVLELQQQSFQWIFRVDFL